MAAPLHIPREKKTSTKKKKKSPWRPNTQQYDTYNYPPYPPMDGSTPFKNDNFYTSGTSNEQLNIYLYPHQTLFTHNNFVTYLSDKLTVEHLPCIQLPIAFNSKSTFFDYFFKCFTYFFVSICKCSLFGMGNILSMSNQDSNWYNTRLVINNNNIKNYMTATSKPTSITKKDPIPYICLSPSLQTSSSYSIGRRNFVSPTADASSISSPLSRKILSINLTAQHHSSLIINISNLFAYIINDTTIYNSYESAEGLSSGELMLDFQSPTLPYKLAISPTYTNENNDRLLSSLERTLSTITRFRPNANALRRNNANNANNANNNNEEIRDLVSRRTTARASYRKKIRKEMVKQRQGYCCVDILRYLLLILSLALFPAVFILILMNQVLEHMSYDNTLPIFNTLCLVELQCPHYRRRKKRKNKGKVHNLDDDTMIFLESNGDIYHKYLGEEEKFYIRGECIIAFDKSLKNVSVCNYGQNGTNMREYRCKGDFIEFVGPGNLWYGNGRQDLLTNSYKLKSLLFCDNLKYADPNYIPNINDLSARNNQQGGNVNNRNNGNNQIVGNYTNGRFGIIQSFELQTKYKIKFIEKCLILSTVTLVFLSILLFVITVHLQPNFINMLINEINQMLEGLNLP